MTFRNQRQYTRLFVESLLESIIGKTLGEIDCSSQFSRTEKSKKITGIAGDVIEQSVFGYERDNLQESDIEIDGVNVELKTTGVRIPKKDLTVAKNKSGDEYNILLGAKEGISITQMTLEPTYQKDFYTSHFWEKAKNLLIVFYEYKSYDVVPAGDYATFPIIGYTFNQFSDEDTATLKSDWEIVRDYLAPYYKTYLPDIRREMLIGFTHKLRPQLLLIELVPGYKQRPNGSFQTPRYRLKQTFVDYIVRRHFSTKKQQKESSITKSFSSFQELDKRCSEFTKQFKGKTFADLKEYFSIPTPLTNKSFGAQCVIAMFGGTAKRLNDISDFNKAGIIAKTITLTPTGLRKEDMKLKRIDFEEWADRDIEFKDSEIYEYFTEHSILCPIFSQHNNKIESITFEGFKRFSFDDDFIETSVKKVWEDSRKLIHSNSLVWEYELDSNGHPIRNKSGSFKGAPNFPKSSDYKVFFRGGGMNSSERHRTETVNNISILPQFYWLKGSYVVDKLKSLPYL